jgi:hypothetical protein
MLASIFAFLRTLLATKQPAPQAPEKDFDTTVCERFAAEGFAAALEHTRRALRYSSFPGWTDEYLRLAAINTYSAVKDIPPSAEELRELFAVLKLHNKGEYWDSTAVYRRIQELLFAGLQATPEEVDTLINARWWGPLGILLENATFPITEAQRQRILTEEKDGYLAYHLYDGRHASQVA